jgi:hypothetical protein
MFGVTVLAIVLAWLLFNLASDLLGRPPLRAAIFLGDNIL